MTRKPLFYNYMLTNRTKTVLYTGVTNNLHLRLIAHWIGSKKSFTSRYNVYYLIWYECGHYILNAIAREKEIKRMTRLQKEQLIESFNPQWKFLNEDILGIWPPSPQDIDYVRSFLLNNPDALHR